MLGKRTVFVELRFVVFAYRIFPSENISMSSLLMTILPVSSNGAIASQNLDYGHSYRSLSSLSLHCKVDLIQTQIEGTG